MNPNVQEKIKELGDLCRRFKVRQLDLFGSGLDESRFSSGSSDLDFLVEFFPLAEDQYADSYFGLLFSLEDLFGRPVDLVMTEAIRNPYFKQSVERSRRKLYAA